MLVVISDLHFTEERSSAVPGAGAKRHGRNLHPSAFLGLFERIVRNARRNGARRIDLVFAGDVFDLHRTALWFEDDLRPWSTGAAGEAALEPRTLDILEAIAAEPWVAGALRAIREFAAGRYRLEDGRTDEVPVPVALHYLPGNHDRLAGRFGPCRRRVRELLGMAPDDAPFPTHLLFEAERTLVRHGHEYDRYNFSIDLEHGKRPIPAEIPAGAYADPAFGDLVTVDIAARLPWLFRRRHGARIAGSPDLEAVDARLRAFDDVRPQSALGEFLLARTHDGLTPARVWRILEPVVRELLEELAENRAFGRWLKRLDARWRPDAIDLVQAALDLRLWRAGIPLRAVRRLVRYRPDGARHGGGAERCAAREALVRDGTVRMVVAGHTHRPRVSALAGGPGGGVVYVDTGTWRRRILAAPDSRGFVELEALAVAVVYAPDEAPGRGGEAGAVVPFDWWDGLRRRLPAGNGEVA